MFNSITGEHFLRDGLNTTESPKVLHCAPGVFLTVNFDGLFRLKMRSLAM